jgi:hypothetical protein
MSGLTYDDATHTYKLDGVVVPSVTQVLTAAGVIDNRWFTEEATHRGQLVHVATMLMDQGELNDARSSPRLPIRGHP